MAKLEDAFEGSLSKVFVTVGSAVIAPTVVPILTSASKPLIKGIIKAGFVLYQGLYECAAEATERFHDLLAEVEEELKPPAGSSLAKSRPRGDSSAEG